MGHQDTGPWDIGNPGQKPRGYIKTHNYLDIHTDIQTNRGIFRGGVHLKIFFSFLTLIVGVLSRDKELLTKHLQRKGRTGQFCIKTF